ncbi:DUF2730 family protein [Pseudodesulfovibrio sp.]|uniref:DUF2730 family protein n=1 Tax=unclassified Pseudodesulfovibrio TaxID=2661612 RepID=UPI003AFF91D8
MDLHALDLILRILQVVFLPIVGLLIKLILDQRKSQKEEQKANAKDHTDFEKRLSAAEACLKSAPTEEAIHDLALTIEKFGGSLRVAVEKIEGVDRLVTRLERIVTRHEDYMLNGGKS